MTRHNYPENEWGRPTGRNYTYRVHMDAPEWKRMHRLNRWGLRDIEVNPKDVYAPFPYQAFRTFDNKGKIKGMSQWLYSPAWEAGPWGPGRHESLEIRNATGGGTRIKGDVFVGYDNDDLRFDYVEIDTTVSFTPTELTAIIEGTTDEVPRPERDGATITADEARERINDELFWAEQDAIDAAVEAAWSFRDECDHDHKVTFDAPQVGVTVCRSSGYCEDCGLEFEAEL